VFADRVHLSRPMSVYAATWQLASIALAFLIAGRFGAPAGGFVAGAVAAASAANVVLFAALHRVRKPAWDVVLRLHAGVLMLPVMLAFVPVLGPARTAGVFLVYLVPIALTARWWLARGGFRLLSDRTRARGTVPRSVPSGSGAEAMGAPAPFNAS
jgi:hypothetical protein